MRILEVAHCMSLGVPGVVLAQQRKRCLHLQLPTVLSNFNTRSTSKISSCALMRSGLEKIHAWNFLSFRIESLKIFDDHVDCCVNSLANLHFVFPCEVCQHVINYVLAGIGSVDTKLETADSLKNKKKSDILSKYDSTYAQSQATRTHARMHACTHAHTHTHTILHILSTNTPDQARRSKPGQKMFQTFKFRPATDLQNYLSQKQKK